MTGPVYRDHMWLGGNVLVNNSKIPVGDEYSLIHYSILHSFGCSEKVTVCQSSLHDASRLVLFPISGWNHRISTKRYENDDDYDE